MSENHGGKENALPIEPSPDAAAATSGEAASPPGQPPAPLPADPSDKDIDQQMRRLSRRSFLWAAGGAVAGVAGWRWLATRRSDDGIPWPLRRMLEVNEQLSRDYFKTSRLAPTFPRAQAGEPRLNGDIGLEEGYDPDDWTLRVEGLAASPEPLELTLDDLLNLPRAEMVTELKCIEGWSQVVYWAGARFADFAAQYKPVSRQRSLRDPGMSSDEWVRYVSLATPNGRYYVGLDMASALHSQTLLCYEMNGAPLTVEHGAPLRLVIPLKYGIKSIKRLGTIRFSDTRPADYWAERGYDWYAGH